jgi:hypothetical protein
MKPIKQLRCFSYDRYGSVTVVYYFVLFIIPCQGWQNYRLKAFSLYVNMKTLRECVKGYRYWAESLVIYFSVSKYGPVIYFKNYNVSYH